MMICDGSPLGPRVATEWTDSRMSAHSGCKAPYRTDCSTITSRQLRQFAPWGCSLIRMSTSCSDVSVPLKPLSTCPRNCASDSDELSPAGMAGLPCVICTCGGGPACPGVPIMCPFWRGPAAPPRWPPPPPPRRGPPPLCCRCCGCACDCGCGCGSGSACACACACACSGLGSFLVPPCGFPPPFPRPPPPPGAPSESERHHRRQ
jgi:hypothetical protein